MKTTLTEQLEKVRNETYNYIIIDGMNMSFKYYYGLYVLKNKEGEKTGLYHGFLYLITSLQIKYPYAKIIIAWEGDDLVRKKKFYSYKENRQPKPDIFNKSVLKLKYLLGLMGIVQKYAPGYEADDVAAYYCDKFRDERLLLISEDSDWFQIVNRNCSILRKNKEYTYENLEIEKGYPPERILLYKIIKGDAKDNIAGISYFPELLAKEIVKSCKYLGDIYKFKPSDRKYNRWMAKLNEEKELLTFNYEILKLRTDIKLEDLPCQKKNITMMRKELINLQLYKILNMMKMIV